MTLRCRCLGSLEVRNGDQWRPVGSAKARSLLAVLIVHVGEHVPVGRLVEEIWAGRPPRSANTLVRGYVLTIRRSFGADGGALVVGHAKGYRLDLPPAALDVQLFEQQYADGQVALHRGDAAGASRLLTGALDLWRGPALADVPRTPAITAYVAGLQERRLGALEARIETDLRVGRHAEILGELRQLIARHPGRERLVGQWMRALHATGRRAEALNAYVEAHKRLADHFGIDPGPDLRKIHWEILAAEDEASDPSGEVLPTGSGDSGPRGSSEDWTTPSQLPADVSDFTGRQAELAHCLGLLAAGAPTVRVVAVSGRAGVGKSALGVRLAHSLRGSYPDGQLYADLGGDTDRPADPAEVLAMFLRSIGVPGAAVPERPDERAALLRSRLADRRVLLVLENAASERQIRPLLPGGAGCAVIVTGRTRLSGLEGCRLVDLEVFSPESALGLFERVVGGPRVAEDLSAARELVALCGHLPLAVRIAAARVASAPGTPLRWFVGRVADERRRLDELRVRDLDVRASIGAGYALLADDEQRVLRLLALLEVGSFPGWVAGAVADIGADPAARALRALVDQRLLDEVGVDRCGQPRYRFHNLIRLFARERAMLEPVTARTAAVERAVQGWLTLARRADLRLPAQTLARLPGPGPGRPVPDEVVELATGAPFEWFEAERDAIGDLVAQVAGLGRADLAWQLAAAAYTFYELRDLYDDGQRTHELALRVCRDAGDELGQAVMARNLAGLYSSKPGSSVEEKLAHAELALRLFRRTEESHGEADALYLCATVHRTLGRSAEADRCVAASLRIARRTGYRLGELHAWQLSAILRRQQGRADNALTAAFRALSIADELPSSRERSVMLGLIGVLHRERSDWRRAEAALVESIKVAEETGDPVQLAFVSGHLGAVYVDSGDPRARRVLARGLALSSACRSVFGQALALHALGRLELRDGHPRRAVARLTDAATLYRQAQNRYAEAKALAGLAEAWSAAADPARALVAGRSAVEIYRRLGNDVEADQVAAAIDHRSA